MLASHFHYFIMAPRRELINKQKERVKAIKKIRKRARDVKATLDSANDKMDALMEGKALTEFINELEEADESRITIIDHALLYMQLTSSIGLQQIRDNTLTTFDILALADVEKSYNKVELALREVEVENDLRDSIESEAEEESVEDGEEVEKENKHLNVSIGSQRVDPDFEYPPSPELAEE